MLGIICCRKRKACSNSWDTQKIDYSSRINCSRVRNSPSRCLEQFSFVSLKTAGVTVAGLHDSCQFYCTVLLIIENLGTLVSSVEYLVQYYSALPGVGTGRRAGVGIGQGPWLGYCHWPRGAKRRWSLVSITRVEYYITTVALNLIT